METIKISDALNKAADTIENGYWYRGLRGGDIQSYICTNYAVVKWEDYTPTIGVRGGCLFTEAGEADHTDSALEYLKGFLGLHTNKQLFELNDSQPVDEGRQWAIKTLREAAASARKEGL